jgi:hypothetical protein
MKTIHVWMPDGRSLCDRRAQLRRPDPTTMTDQEFEEYVDEQTNAPACGSCLLLAQHLQHAAATIYESQGGEVHPPTPIQGWRDVRDTRWATHVNLPEFLKTPGLAKQLQYDRIKQGVAPHRLAEWVDQRKQETERTMDWLRRRRTGRPGRPVRVAVIPSVRPQQLGVSLGDLFTQTVKKVSARHRVW